MRALPALLLLALAREASAYDFELTSRSIGQAYQIRWLRFSEADRLLNRRRFTQELGLDAWNLLQPDFDPGYPDRPRRAPADLYFKSSLRFDHDFGGFLQGDTSFVLGETPVTQSARSAVPELTGEDLSLEVLYAYVGGRHLLGFLDFALGRQILVDNLDWTSFDGLSLRATAAPAHQALEAWGGWIVRESSPVASSAHEPDGTGSAQCQAFMPESGAYLPVDECAQRQQAMPGFGVALATTGLRWLQARASYRYVASPSAPDTYVDLRGEAPTWGVNQESASASLRLNLFGGAVIPWGAARYNFVIGLLDEAHAGARFGFTGWAITPEFVYSYPSFDGDSIFNVFSTQPYWDYRLTWDLAPLRSPWRGFVRGYLRHFKNSDFDTTTQAETVSLEEDALGVDGGLRLRGARGSVRLDLFYEGGYGGLRAGGDLSGRVRLLPTLELEGRVSLIRFEEDSLADLSGTTFGAQGGALLRLGEGMAIHFLAEENSNRFDASQFRLMAVLDLAFLPEH